MHARDIGGCRYLSKTDAYRHSAIQCGQKERPIGELRKCLGIAIILRVQVMKLVVKCCH